MNENVLILFFFFLLLFFFKTQKLKKKNIFKIKKFFLELSCSFFMRKKLRTPVSFWFFFSLNSGWMFVVCVKFVPCCFVWVYLGIYDFNVYGKKWDLAQFFFFYFSTTLELNFFPHTQPHAPHPLHPHTQKFSASEFWKSPYTSIGDKQNDLGFFFYVLVFWFFFFLGLFSPFIIFLKNTFFATCVQ